jgi:hypothetical protein
MDVGPTQVARITLVTSVDETEARNAPCRRNAGANIPHRPGCRFQAILVVSNKILAVSNKM